MASKNERLENNCIEILLATEIMEQIMQISCKSPDMTNYQTNNIITFSQTYICQLRMNFKINTNYTTQLFAHIFCSLFCKLLQIILPDS
jgi:hypothetical protein